ncbi:MAG: YbaB/EbfC family nucleoid-associated protein [Candidatus Nealsonbacteria bacterium]|nr:YbaB/EbfC family nucleoid-associated protein [Candidatus Nealsonbacteria bacterium]
MFEKLKQLKQINDLKNALAQERREVSQEGVRVVVNGKMEIEEIVLNPELNCASQGKIVRDCLNEAFRQIQAEVAKKMLQL